MLVYISFHMRLEQWVSKQPVIWFDYNKGHQKNYDSSDANDDYDGDSCWAFMTLQIYLIRAWLMRWAAAHPVYLIRKLRLKKCGTIAITNIITNGPHLL